MKVDTLQKKIELLVAMGDYLTMGLGYLSNELNDAEKEGDSDQKKRLQNELDSLVFTCDRVAARLKQFAKDLGGKAETE